MKQQGPHVADVPLVFFAATHLLTPASITVDTSIMSLLVGWYSVALSAYISYIILQ